MSDNNASDGIKEKEFTEDDLLLIKEKPKNATVITNLTPEKQKRIVNIKMRFFGRKMYRVVMNHVNETESIFYVKIKHGQYYKWKDYYFFVDENAAKYNNTAKCWQLEYHERCSMPIYKHLTFSDITDATTELIKSELENQGLDPKLAKKWMLTATFDPRVSKSIIESDFVQKVANKGEMDKKLAIMMAINAVIAVAIIGIVLFLFQIYNMISGIQGVG